MATGTDKFMNYNGLVKLIGLIKKLAQSVAKTVKYNRKSENAYIPLVTGMGASITDGSINEVGYNEGVSFNPSSNTLRVESGNTSVKISPDIIDIIDSHGEALSVGRSYIEFYDENGDLASTLRANTYGGHASGTEFDLNATGSGKGADMVKYDTNTTYASGSVGAAITALQGAVGGGDLVKSVDNATQDNGNYNNVNIIPNYPRTGNYTKANDASGIFTYYETRYGLATANSGSGASVVQGMSGLMSADDKTNLDAIVAAFPDKEISRLVVTVTKSGDVYSADKTPLEISNAINEGRDVVVFYSGTIYNLAIVSNPYMFVSSHPNNAQLLFFTFNGSTIRHSEVNLVPNTTEINGKALSSNITLKSGDIGLTSNITIDSATTTDVQAALTALNTLAAANKSAISTLQSGGLTREVVTALPTGTSIKTNVIYMILASNDPLDGGDPSTSATTTPYGTNNNSYNEYMYINNAWERIGSTEVNLDIDPITDDEIDTAWSTTVAAA